MATFSFSFVLISAVNVSFALRLQRRARGVASGRAVNHLKGFAGNVADRGRSPEVVHATMPPRHNMPLAMTSLIQTSLSSLHGVGSLQGYVDHARANIYLVGLVVTLVMSCCCMALCWLRMPSDPEELLTQARDKYAIPLSLSVVDEFGKSIPCRNLLQDTDFALLRAKVDESRGLSLNERSILIDAGAVLGKDKIGRTLKDMGVVSGSHLVAQTQRCPKVLPGIFQTSEKRGSCIRATVRVGWHGTVQVVIIKHVDANTNIRFNESFIIDSVDASQERVALSLVKECKTSIIEKLWLVGAPGRRVLMAAQNDNGHVGSPGFGCWTSSTRLRENPAMSIEAFATEYNLGLPMELSKRSLDMQLWAVRGEDTLLQGWNDESD